VQRDLQEVLRDLFTKLLHTNLTPERWEELPAILASTEDVLTSEDPQTTTELIEDLEVLVTFRVKRIGTPTSDPTSDPIPAPIPIREHLTDLIKRIGLPPHPADNQDH
jgi:hypothetical protein